MWSLKQFDTTWIQVFQDFCPLGAQLERGSCSFVAKVASGILDCFRRGIARAKRSDPSPLLSTGVATSRVLGPVLGSLVQKREGDTLKMKPSKELQQWLRDWRIFPKRKVWEGWDCSVYWKASSGQIASLFTSIWRKDIEMMELNSFQRCPLGRTKGNGQILKQEVPDEPQERFVSERATEHCHRLLRSCGITNLEELQKSQDTVMGRWLGKQL